uniref:CSON015325 protein n=1 Tax=Culicoides sonorensis TaxID=179676 RepID=A0A336LNF0_CULSO
MGSVAVRSDHRDRYFGKLPLSEILVNPLQDSESIKNAFEISGRKNYGCLQGPKEANKWLELLIGNLSDSTKRKIGMELKRNTSAGSMSGNGIPPPPHVSNALNLMCL